MDSFKETHFSLFSFCTALITLSIERKKPTIKEINSLFYMDDYMQKMITIWTV